MTACGFIHTPREGVRYAKISCGSRFCFHRHRGRGPGVRIQSGRDQRAALLVFGR